MNLDVGFLGGIAIAILSPALVALVLVALNFFLKKTENIKNKDVRENVQMVLQTIARSINFTNQRFVDELKTEGKFDEEAMREAFYRTKKLVEQQVDAEGRAAVEKMHQDFTVFIEAEIESQINESKKYGDVEVVPVAVPIQEDCEYPEEFPELPDEGFEDEFGEGFGEDAHDAPVDVVEEDYVGSDEDAEAIREMLGGGGSGNIPTQSRD